MLFKFYIFSFRVFNDEKKKAPPMLQSVVSFPLEEGLLNI